MFIRLTYTGLLFHSFPVDQHRFELWRQTVFTHCSQTLSINKHSKICYRHFHSDDYINFLRLITPGEANYGGALEDVYIFSKK